MKDIETMCRAFHEGWNGSGSTGCHLEGIMNPHIYVVLAVVGMYI